MRRSYSGELLRWPPLRGQEWCSNPRRCPIVSDPPLQKRQVRHLLYGTKPHIYRILFRVLEEHQTVEVLHIRHGAIQQSE